MRWLYWASLYHISNARFATVRFFDTYSADSTIHRLNNCNGPWRVLHIDTWYWMIYDFQALTRETGNAWLSRIWNSITRCCGQRYFIDSNVSQKPITHHGLKNNLYEQAIISKRLSCFNSQFLITNSFFFLFSSVMNLFKRSVRSDFLFKRDQWEGWSLPFFTDRAEPLVFLRAKPVQSLLYFLINKALYWRRLGLGVEWFEVFMLFCFICFKICF